MVREFGYLLLANTCVVCERSEVITNALVMDLRRDYGKL